MPFDFPQGGDKMYRIAKEAQIHDDDFARRSSLIIEIGGHGLHIGVKLKAAAGFATGKLSRPGARAAGNRFFPPPGSGVME